MASRVDKWRLVGRLDEAEILLDKKKNQESVEKYVESVKAYATELKNGIDSYLLGCNSENGDKIRNLTRTALAEFFLNDSDNQPFEKLLADVSEIKDTIRR
jgi:hypothetical protein